MPTPKYHIQSYCYISLNGVTLNEKFEASHASNFDAYLKTLYKNQDIKYPKFFKMDTLSKLAFLGAEFLLNGTEEEVAKTALVFSNRSGSLDTDRKHQEAISSTTEAYPSPAVFVYTLPNIGMGEVAIRHQLHTENAFFVFERFTADFLQKYTLSLLHSKKAKNVLCAWVEVDGDSRHGFFYLVSEHGKIPHTRAAIDRLYKGLTMKYL